MRTHDDDADSGHDSLGTVLLTERQQLYITRCMLLGCTFVHNDFGHPERKFARNHYQCHGDRKVGWGHSEAEAAYDYLRRYHPELLDTP